MPRKRQELTRAQEQKLISMMTRGGTAERNTKELRAAGIEISRATVARRMLELSGKVKKKRAKAVAAARDEKPAKSPPSPPRAAAATQAAKPLPVSSEAIPEDADPNTIDAWLETANRLAAVAESDGDLDSWAKMGRLTASLLEHKRKAQPPEKPDPNEDPDMIALGAEVSARFHALLKDESQRLKGAT